MNKIINYQNEQKNKINESISVLIDSKNYDSIGKILSTNNFILDEPLFNKLLDVENDWRISRILIDHINKNSEKYMLFLTKNFLNKIESFCFSGDSIITFKNSNNVYICKKTKYFFPTVKATITNNDNIDFSQNDFIKNIKKLIFILNFSNLANEAYSADEILKFQIKTRTFKEEINKTIFKSNNKSNDILHHILPLYETLGERLTSLYKQKENEYIEQIQNEIIQNDIYSIAEKSLEKTIKINKENIPNDIKFEINKINSLYSSLISMELNEEQSFIVKKIYNEKIPNIIEKFLGVDIDFRTKLQDRNGKNAEELTIDSLKEITQSFDKIFLENKINKSTNNLSELTVQNNYLKKALK